MQAQLSKCGTQVCLASDGKISGKFQFDICLFFHVVTLKNCNHEAIGAPLGSSSEDLVRVTLEIVDGPVYVGPWCWWSSRQ